MKKLLHLLSHLIFTGLFLVFLTSPSEVSAADPGVQFNLSLGGEGAEMSTGLQLLLLFSVLSLAPAIVVMTTSFTRIVVVLSFLRTALGTQQPSSQIVVAMSLFLTGFIMFPVWTQIDKEAITPMREKKMEASEAIPKAIRPLKQFMLRHTRAQDLDLFLSLAASARGADKTDTSKETEPDLQVVIPAFMVSELRTAFQMGFVIFLPFLVIDMVVSSILMAMGMMMLPPAMVTLPLKILVFVLADGWTLIMKSLVLSFQ